jgi:hypothetical protein
VVFGTQVPLSHVHEVFVGHNSGSSLTQLPRLLQTPGTVTVGVVGSGVVVAGVVVLEGVVVIGVFGRHSPLRQLQLLREGQRSGDIAVQSLAL